MKKGRYYNKFDFYNLTSEDLTEGYLISRFKTFQQTRDNTCASCCVKMVLEHYEQGSRYDELALVKELNTKSYPYGTTLISIINFIKNKGYKIESSLDKKKDKNGLCFSTYQKFKDFVLKNLKKEQPLIVENVDYGGHYRVIIGLDQQSNGIEEDMLIFADPSDLNDCSGQDGYTFFPAHRFYYMWFDDNCLNQDEKKQPFVVIKRKK